MELMQSESLCVLDISNNNIWFYSNNILNEQFQAYGCLDGADNYIDLDKKIVA